MSYCLNIVVEIYRLCYHAVFLVRKGMTGISFYRHCLFIGWEDLGEDL